ncbi:hypothetical protein BG006_009929 [Podila minutissima]|uniref:Uncharacterized protein n=1 Tax=Podila minutissima TaxID=64525 RepID=A0A9P5SUS8_9FUNG|nr:hypothetical protein BG006_009929 [Podila minutissima]
MAEKDGRDETYCRDRAESKREAAVRTWIDDDVKQRIKAAEDHFKCQLKDAEARFRWQLRDANDRAQRRLQAAEDPASLTYIDMSISLSTSATPMVDAKQNSIVAGMAGVSLQSLKSEKLPAYSTVKGEEPVTVYPAANDEGAELQWFLEIFRNAKGETFAKLFDLLERRYDQDEGYIHRQAIALSASNPERKSQLAIELLDLRMERSRLQSQKRAYLADPEAQGAIREEVLVKVLGMTQSQNKAQEHSPPASVEEIQYQEFEQEEYVKEVQKTEQQEAFRRAKADETRRDNQRRIVEYEANRRNRHAEETSKLKEQYAEKVAKMKKQREENSISWQKQSEEESKKWYKEFVEDQAKWMKEDAEEFARWRKEVDADMSKWKDQESEQALKWHKKHAEEVARRRIKNTEDLAKKRAMEGQERARLRIKEVADRAGSTEKDPYKAINEAETSTLREA